MQSTPLFVGIDVSKERLDTALRPSSERWATPNEAHGISTLCRRLQPLAPALIVLEATGGLELPVVGALAAAGLPVVVVNPRQVRDFAKATGSSPRPTSLTPRSWHTSPRRSAHRCGRCRMPRRRRWTRC